MEQKDDWNSYGGDLQRIVNDDIKKPIDSKELFVWEERCKQERGIIEKTISNNLQVHIKVEDNPIDVWKTLASLYDKFYDVSSYYLENKIHELYLNTLRELSHFLLN